MVSTLRSLDELAVSPATVYGRDVIDAYRT